MKRTQALMLILGGGALVCGLLYLRAVSLRSPPAPQPPYAQNAEAAYWYGMRVYQRIELCLASTFTTELVMALADYGWKHEFPRECTEIRTIAETLKPKPTN